MFSVRYLLWWYKHRVGSEFSQSVEWSYLVGERLNWVELGWVGWWVSELDNFWISAVMSCCCDKLLAKVGDNSGSQKKRNIRRWKPLPGNGYHVTLVSFPADIRLKTSTIQITSIIYLFIYFLYLFKLQMGFTRWQWYYNKTQLTNNTHHIK
jgi:hypothetical protein